MKKILGSLISVLFLVGCSFNMGMKDTPTKKVEEFLNRYQTLHQDVLSQLTTMVEEEVTFTDDQKNKYQDLMKKHYQNLKYEIKDESIDGDNATVKTEIEVTDFSIIMRDSDTYLTEHPEEFNDANGAYDVTLFNDYRLKRLSEANEKVKYTINFTLTKVDDEWRLDDLNEIDESKIQGTYSH